MNEALLKNALIQAYEKEFAEFDNVKQHKFSRRHTLNMKRILNGNFAESDHKRSISFNRQLVFIAAIIAAAAVLAVDVAAIITNGFSTKVFSNRTETWSLNMENCPETLDSFYYLSEIPEGYVKENENCYPTFVIYEYSNGSKSFSFTQYVKKDFRVSYNTEGYEMEPISVNEHSGFLINFGENGITLVWDNGDYVLEIDGNITKNEAINLAKSAKS